jgi:hypothetical protein
MRACLSSRPPLEQVCAIRRAATQKKPRPGTPDEKKVDPCSASETLAGTARVDLQILISFKTESS